MVDGDEDIWGMWAEYWHKYVSIYAQSYPQKSVPNQVERQKWNTKRCILGTPPDPLILLGFSTKNPKSGTPFGHFLEHHLAIFWNTIWPFSGTPFGGFLEHHLAIFWNTISPFSGTPFGGFLEHHFAVFWNTIWRFSGTPFASFLEHVDTLI